MDTLYVHQNNFLNKINTNYNKAGVSIEKFYKQKYLNLRNKVDSLIFNRKQIKLFDEFALLLTDYYRELKIFSHKYNIESQSKLESSFLEEISMYLFKNLKNVKNNTYSIFNNKVFRGLFVSDFENISVLVKDVDFCIGKELEVTFGKQNKQVIRIPLVAVEVKTYTDSTMFSGIKSAFSDIKSAIPICHTYLLSGYVAMQKNHISVAKGYSFLNDIFSLCKNSDFIFDARALFEYWKEIKEVVDSDKCNNIKMVGRLLN